MDENEKLKKELEEWITIRTIRKKRLFETNRLTADSEIFDLTFPVENYIHFPTEKVFFKVCRILGIGAYERKYEKKFGSIGAVYQYTTYYKGTKLYALEILDDAQAAAADEANEEAYVKCIPVKENE